MNSCKYCKINYKRKANTSYFCSPKCLIYGSILKNENGCWLWTKAKGKDGYGRIRFEKKYYRSHRFSYWHLKEKFPDNLHVLHKCDTPLCVNPDHLFLGSNTDNQKDMDKKGRRKVNRRYSEEQINEIISLHKKGVTQYRLSKIFNCRHSNIWQIIHKRNIKN